MSLKKELNPNHKKQEQIKKKIYRKIFKSFYKEKVIETLYLL